MTVRTADPTRTGRLGLILCIADWSKLATYLFVSIFAVSVCFFIIYKTQPSFYPTDFRSASPISFSTLSNPWIVCWFHVTLSSLPSHPRTDQLNALFRVSCEETNNLPRIVFAHGEVCSVHRSIANSNFRTKFAITSQVECISPDHLKKERIEY